MKKKLILSCVCLLLVLSIFGCGKKEDNPPDTSASLTPQEILTKSTEAMKDIKNYKADMDIDMNMSAQGTSIDMKMKMAMDIFLNPLKVKMIMDMEIPMMGEATQTEMYMIQEGDNLVTYIEDPVNGEWIKESTPFSEELMEQYNQAQYSELFVNSLKEAVIATEEQVQGIDCWKIDVTLNPEAFMDIMAKTQGADTMFGDVSLEQIKAMGDMQAAIWIAKDTFYQAKVDMDLTENIKAIIPSDQGVTIDKVIMSMVVFDFDKAVDFTLPEAAK